MKIKEILFAVAIMLICGCTHIPQKNRIPDWQIEGNQVTNPIQPNVRYYFAGQHLVSRLPHTKKKDVGLWMSEDSGQSWMKCSSLPGLTEVLVHPKTGKLYAILLDEFSTKTPDGSLVLGGGYKVCASSDGNDWKDITPHGDRLDRAAYIFPDPDHTNRICFMGYCSNSVVFQASKDDLSEWLTFQSAEWSAMHKGWNWTGFYAEFEVGGGIRAAQHFQPGNNWQERLRQKCHKKISKRGSRPHDAFVLLAEVGNKESIPLLISALQWQDLPTKKHGAICTTYHCLEDLASFTGQNFGFDQDKWKKWWNEEGKTLPEEYFRPRTANQSSEATPKPGAPQ